MAQFIPNKSPAQSDSDSEKGSDTLNATGEASIVAEFTEAEQKAVLRKIDWHLLPILIAAYLVKNLDVNNISYIKIMNAGKDSNILKSLHMTTNDYAWLSTIYTIPFILTEVPSNLLLKKVGPRAHIARIVFLWSVVATLHAATKNFAEILVARFFLGLFEGGLYPGILALMCYWYRPDELAVRFILLGLLGTFSGILSAILAWGITSLDGRGGLTGWQYMFMIEGLIGILVAAWAWFFLPAFPNTATFLTLREREFVVARLPKNSARSTDKNFELSGITTALKSPTLWLFTAQQLFQNIGTYGLSFWLPSIIAAFGFTTTQSMNIPPAVVGICSGIAFAYYSDRLTSIPRPLWSLVAGLGTIATFICLALVKNKPALYAMTILAGFFNQAFYAVMMPWRSQSLQGGTNTAFSFAFQNGLAQIGGIIGPQVFRAQYAPDYRIPFIVCLVFQALAFIAVAATWYVTKDLERETRRVTAERRATEKASGKVSGAQVDGPIP
ncbi:hypothetical protein MNV49_002543 [Pseudohyphozyma bogoriensis]|nr:hypothetical protein MNV49_002543 [Pseudohyphozyma bogoriensis]